MRGGSQRYATSNTSKPPPAGSASGRKPGAAMVRTAAAAAAFLALALLLFTTASAQQLGLGAGSIGQGAAAITASVAAAAGTAAAARQLPLVPQKLELAGYGNELLYQLPVGSPNGLLILLHKCGRSASDHWPRSSACPDCLGLPESLSKLKQALARGYAVAAMSSSNRATGGGGRCWSWGHDARAVAAAVDQLPGRFRLAQGAPVYVGGASSGGSVALRLPQLVRFDGVFGEVIGPGGMAQLIGRMRDSFPPAAYVHMPRDEGMAAKVQENLEAIRGAGLPAGEIQVRPRALYPAYFSDRSPAISRRLSGALFDQLERMELLDDRRLIALDPKNVVWNAFRSYLDNELPGKLSRLQPAQQEQSVRVVEAHVWECISLAWAQHETVGEYLTAVLMWLEGGGKDDLAVLAKRYRVARPSALTVPAAPRRQA